jgi:predicted  nucleic acid-binding Zn-ribbon protein
MWQCDNCGYTDEDGTTFEEETEEGSEETVRYCPECGSDEVFIVDEEGEGDDDFEDDGEEEDDEEEGDDADNWDDDEDDDDDEDTGDGDDGW